MAVYLDPQVVDAIGLITDIKPLGISCPRPRYNQCGARLTAIISVRSTMYLSSVMAVAALFFGNSLSCAAATKGATTRPVVVVELFTSEGCSSCPSADDYVNGWAAKPPVEGVEVLPLAFHVDYWNTLGWVDHFSKAAYSQRQRDYVKVLHIDQTYTPQMFIDGSG